MNRKLSSAASKITNLSQRAGTAFDQERDEFEKSQRDAMVSL